MFNGTYYEAVGLRKTAIARVRLFSGTGAIVVNDKPVKEYFTREVDREYLLAPLKVTETLGAFDISVKVQGGGVSGQAGAIRHGVARALLKANPALRVILRQNGFLTRDPREKERKKPGLKRARKAPQYTKR